MVKRNPWKTLNKKGFKFPDSTLSEKSGKILPEKSSFFLIIFFSSRLMCQNYYNFHSWLFKRTFPNWIFCHIFRLFAKNKYLVNPFFRNVCPIHLCFVTFCVQWCFKSVQKSFKEQSMNSIITKVTNEIVHSCIFGSMNRSLNQKVTNEIFIIFFLDFFERNFQTEYFFIIFDYLEENKYLVNNQYID